MSLPNQPTVEQFGNIIFALQEDGLLLRECVAQREAENERFRYQVPPPPPAPELSDLPHFVNLDRTSREEAEKHREAARGQEAATEYAIRRKSVTRCSPP
jgi:hypothetical protein